MLLLLSPLLDLDVIFHVWPDHTKLGAKFAFSRSVLMVSVLSLNEECFCTREKNWPVDVSANLNPSYRLLSHFQHASVTLV